MNYPYKASGGNIPEVWFKHYKPEPHEYLIAVSDKAAGTPTSKNVASVTLLGFIDLSTDEREDNLTKLTWELSGQELSGEKYKGLFQPLAIYHVKCLPPVRPWYSGRTGSLYLTEIVGAEKSDAFTESLIKKYTESLHLHSDVLGVLDSVDEYPAYRGSFNWLGNEIEIIVSAEYSPVSEALERTEDFCRKCEFHDRELKEFAASCLLEEANELMQSSFTKEEMIAGAKLRRLEMNITGFYFAELFFNGYIICVEGELSGPEKADIHKYDPEYDD